MDTSGQGGVATDIFQDQQHSMQGRQESGAILVGDMSRTKEMTGAAKVRSVPSTAEKR